jgi:hypothetical protein
MKEFSSTETGFYTNTKVFFFVFFRIVKASENYDLWNNSFQSRKCLISLIKCKALDGENGYKRNMSLKERACDDGEAVELLQVTFVQAVTYNWSVNITMARIFVLLKGNEFEVTLRPTFLVSCPFWSKWPDVTFIWVTITFFIFHVERPLWREDGSVICSAMTQVWKVTIPYWLYVLYNTFGTSRNFARMFDTKNEWKSWV